MLCSRFTTTSVLCFLGPGSLLVGAFATGDPDLFKPLARPLAADISNLSTSYSSLFARSSPLDSLFARQEEECGYPVPCDGNAWCCPAEYQCCPTAPQCCPVSSNCRSGGKCCPDTAETCGGVACTDAGASCCGDPPAFACPAGLECNTQGGQQCCTPDELKCNDTCCPAGSTCASAAGYCSSVRLTELSVATTFTSTEALSTSVSFFETTATSVEEFTSTSVPSAACTPGSGLGDLSKRQRPFSNECTRDCSPTGELLPVWELSNRLTETDQLVLSMCTGMAARIAAGTIGSDNDGEDILSYNGKGVRNEANCGGFCTQLSIELGTPMQCDEYPPASLNPKGGAQTRVCIPQYQNSGTQGPMWAKIIKTCDLGANDKVLVRIKGGCSQYKLPPGKRDLPASAVNLQPRLNDEIHLTAANGTLRNPYGDGSLLYVAAEIDELDDGSYEFQVRCNGSFDSVAILNKYGDVYASGSSALGTVSLSFNLSDGSNLPAALIAYTSEAINITYAGNGLLASASSNSTSSQPSATSATSGSRSNAAGRSPLLELFLYTLVAFISSV